MTQIFDDPSQCAKAVIDRVGREIVLGIPIGIGKPNTFVDALYRLVESDRNLSLKIFTGLTLVRPAFKTDLERRFVGPLLDRLFPTWPDLAYAQALRSGGLPPNIEVHEFFLQAGAWLSNRAVQQSYASLNYRHVAAHLQRIGVNVLAQAVAPEPDGGQEKVSLGSNTDITLDMGAYVEARRRTGAPMAVVGEINSNMPYMPGEAETPRGAFDVILEPPRPHYDLFAPPAEVIPLADYAMALYASTLVKDGGTLQLGIGSFADALAHVLILRHTQNAAFRDLIARMPAPLPADAELGVFEKGLYGCSEMLMSGFLELYRAGILRRQARDGAVLHAAFFLGPRSFYDALREMPRRQLEEIRMTAISFTNSLQGDEARKISERAQARFINTALTATLLGAASSDQLDDGRVISGIGGQGDLVSIAHDLPQARSIIAVRSSRTAARGRRTSNIVWRYGNTSIPRALRDIYVTEYGIADVRGLADAEVAAAMLAIADSAFQAGLQKDATAAGKLSRNFRLPAWARDNNPERMRGVLTQARKEGLLPEFPFGTDFTPTERSLLRPLGTLRSASFGSLARMFVRGIGAGKLSADERESLRRLALEETHAWQEHALRALVIGALRN